MPQDVFISYARKDYEDEEHHLIPDNAVSKIKELLNQNNISFWFDEDGIYSGDEFAPVIAKNIRDSEVFIFVSSANSNISEYTTGEIATAKLYKKKIIPLRVDNSEYNPSVILYLAALDYLDYYKNPEKALNKLIDSIKLYLAEQKAFAERKKNDELSQEQENAIRIEKEKELIRIRENMEIVRVEREKIYSKLLSLEGDAAQVRMELEMIDTGYKDLQYKEAVLLDNDIEFRIKEILDNGKSEVKTIANIPENIRPKRTKSTLMALLSMIVICVLETITVVVLTISNGHKSENLLSEIPVIKENMYIPATDYLDSHDIWNRQEMEKIPGLQGVWDLLNEYKINMISYLSHLAYSKRFADLMDSCQEIIDAGGHFGDINYCTREGDYDITFSNYLKVLLSKRIDLADEEYDMPPLIEVE